MVNMASTDLLNSARLDNKLKPKYSIFAKLSLELVGACEVDLNKHLFLTRAN